MEKARAYLEELKNTYNRYLANNEPVVLLVAIKEKLHGARDVFEMLTGEECCIEEDRYGELELYFYYYEKGEN